MARAGWEQIGDALLLDGGRVTALEVLKALREDGGSSIRADLPGIRFSRTALSCRLRVSGAFPDHLVLSVGVAKNGRFRETPIESGHVVIANAWHPLDPITSGRVGEGLKRHSIEPGPLTAGRFISLTCDIDISDLVADEVEDAGDDRWVERREVLADPPGLRAELYPYQQTGTRFLRTLARHEIGALLADEMGLGKTLQVITLLLDLPTDGRSLVIAPGSLLTNWQREIHQFAPDLAVLTHAGSSRAGVASGLLGARVVLASYETVVNDLSFLTDITWDLVVLDEAQQIRNPGAQRSLAVKALDRRLSVAVTGTPVENRLRDLWSIAEFIVPELLGRLDTFEARFPDDLIAAVQLGQLVSPITLRRKVVDVAADLPERVEIRTPLRLPDAEQSHYLEIAASGNRFTTDVPLRLLCAHANDAPGARYSFASSPKTEHFVDLLEEIFANDEKVLVFASFQTTLDRLAGVVPATEPQAFVDIIDGRTAADQRLAVIDDFSRHDGPGCLLLNPKAAGVGLNITAANHVVHFNPEYNPAVTEQATARSYRRGQDRPVFVHHLFYVDTVEESAIDIADDKRELADGVDRGAEVDDAGEIET